MSEQRIAATIEMGDEVDDWESAGRKLGELLDAAWNNMYEWSDVALKVEGISEDGDVMLSIPGYLSIRIPRWQLEQALERCREGAQ